MGRKGGNKGLPKWWKGRKMLDNLDGSEIFEYSATTRIQDGKYIHKKNFDSLTEEMRQSSIKYR